MKTSSIINISSSSTNDDDLPNVDDITNKLPLDNNNNNTIEDIKNCNKNNFKNTDGSSAKIQEGSCLSDNLLNPAIVNNNNHIENKSSPLLHKNVSSAGTSLAKIANKNITIKNGIKYKKVSSCSHLNSTSNNVDTKFDNRLFYIIVFDCF